MKLKEFTTPTDTVSTRLDVEDSEALVAVRVTVFEPAVV